ncbi:MAG: phosphoribosylformylglycinamidine cyclo-ligase [Nitrososphaerota archaeon]|nr:phosphoribosylformylglycinamidine cyclo-ligase [Nitrososphaerota archaeon]MDG6967133.1 phosphoribosylformylglycinamidine cyclo-ligase [Nitrososphaerota archaeon]MDG6978084.1 phosphoribosylformylglycinamidine cyclo-ligase [Nitrososphaerota archaeon]MDG7005782.1 phosphoribosylformylglycinamidine cyclo-ligase [Nitrososphaerota archaeon]
MDEGAREGAYARAGVDVAKVRAIQGSLAAVLASTFRTRRGKFGKPALAIGHYGGLIDIGGGRLLSLHTDGVGTKVLLAQEMRKFDTVGIDCVAMTVNDLICLGSEPVALLDYMALEREDDALVAQLSRGLVAGAQDAGAAIVGGETAIVGDLLKGVDGYGFDLVSMGVGVVKAASLVDGGSIRAGDAVVGVASSGLHSNGYTLARRIVKGMPMDEPVEELGETLGEALLKPTRIYVRPTLRALKRREVHGIAHITGGAFAKLTRLVGERRLEFSIELPAGGAPPIFGLLQREGRLSDSEMLSTFNMGVGLCVVAPPAEAEALVRDYRRAGFEAGRVGTVKRGRGVVVGATRVA